jgi:hypothetical protein
MIALIVEVIETGDRGTPDRIGFEMFPNQFIGVCIR